MDLDNIFKMVDISYDFDKIKLETKLEEIINCGDLNSEKKVKKIKKYVAKLAFLELQKNKFKIMTDDNDNINK